MSGTEKSCVSSVTAGVWWCVSPQGRALLSRLQGLTAKGIHLKISSGIIDSVELETLGKHCQHFLLLHNTFHFGVYLLSPGCSLFTVLFVFYPDVFPLQPVLPLSLYFSHTWLISSPVSFSLISSAFDWSSTSVSFCFLSPDAEVHLVNMTALTKGHLLSSFWVVDKRHFYIGSASMDWRSLATVFQTHHTS